MTLSLLVIVLGFVLTVNNKIRITLKREYAAIELNNLSTIVDYKPLPISEISALGREKTENLEH